MELEGRKDEPREDEPRDEGGRGGKGEVTVAEAAAKSIVARSSLFETAVPQDEQKRTPSENSVPQATHFAMAFSRYSLPQKKQRGPRMYAGLR